MRDDSYSHDLMDPYFEEQGGRLFILGKVTKECSHSHWNAGRIGALPWDRVTEYFIFDTYKDYQKAIKTASKSNKKK